MQLSRDQQAADTHGIGAAPTFEWVEMPVGPQSLQIWARGLTVDWYDGYSNPPSLVLKTVDGVRDWPGKVYRQDTLDRRQGGYRYLAESGDGRARCHYHGGEVKLYDLQHRHTCYPVLPAPPKTAIDRWSPARYWYESVPCWSTYQDEGYGGDHFPVKLQDGRTVVLRGPWNGPEPDGYTDVYTRGHGVLLVADDVLLTLLARYQPHLRVARVTDRGRSWYEPVKSEWDVPKSCRR